MSDIDVEVTINFSYIEDAFQQKKLGVVLQGSAGSAKTFSALQWIVYYAGQNTNKRIAIYRQFRASAKETLVVDFKRIMGEDFFDCWDDDCWNGSDLVYTFPSGTVVEFIGCDKAYKRKGKRSDISYINEVTEVNRDSFDQINMRTSFMICDFNPSHDHFIYGFRANPDFGYHESTFRDNPKLPEGERATILGYEPTDQNIRRGTANHAKWQIYGLGKPAKLEGLIFTNWEETDEWPNIDACERRGYGCDVGFIDPTVVVNCRLAHNTLYLRQEVWETGITDLPNPESPLESLVERCEAANVSKSEPIYVDCAYPQTVAALSTYGYNAVASTKGKGSVMEGIQLLQRFKIKIHASSRQLIHEFGSYTWRIDPRGTQKQEPIDDFNHGIDAVRYWALIQLVSAGLGYSNARTGKPKKPTVSMRRRALV